VAKFNARYGTRARGRGWNDTWTNVTRRFKGAEALNARWGPICCISATIQAHLVDYYALARANIARRRLYQGGSRQLSSSSPSHH